MTEEHLFDVVLETSPAERSALLDRECASNPELRGRIEALLAADAQPEATVVSPLIGYQPSASIGSIVAGKYKLIQLIGEGGMGSVWLAQQAEPVKRQVALKLIKAGMDSRQVIARFEAERQALAVMDHPNIAKVLDGGLHDGRPFFAMELVKGMPITQYCDAKKLTLRNRLELFVPVCQAIQHAHQKGIIHRDIKPSNVLIAPYDDRPVPKVIDFGLAKATGVALTDASNATKFGGVVGTPQYMSPEQASLNNLDIDTRSDVYSLGVLLYELLTGSPPFTMRELENAGMLEILRVIREDDPPKPSTKLSTAEALPSLSANRGTEPKHLAALLRNELDWIVMRALEKDRSRRYETATDFAADINRYLTGESVRAHPQSTAYRLRKFVHRNRGQVIAASLVFLALVTGMAGTTWGLFRAVAARRDAVAAAKREMEQRKEAEAARAEAQAKEAEANAVVKFFEEKVFAAGRPKNEAGGLGHDVSLRDAIKASLPALGTSFPAQPLVEARLRHTLGMTFFYLGEFAQAAEQLEQARALYTRHLGPDGPSALRNTNALASSYAALNRPADALKLREEMLAERKRMLPPDHSDLLASTTVLANSYAALNRHADAIKLYEESLAAQKRVLAADHSDTLWTMNYLANSYMALKRYAEALELYEETLAARKRALPPDHPDTLRSMNNLANCYAALNRPADALKMREIALSARKRGLPPDHPDILASMTALANSYAAFNRPTEALKLREETLAAQKRVLPADHPDTLRSMVNLANSYAALNRQADAVPLLDAFLAKADRPGIGSRLFSAALAKRLKCGRKLGDLAGCKATAALCEKRNPLDAQNLYDAACSRAVTAALQARAPQPDATRLAQADADKAMGWLTKAIAEGYTDVAHMKKDTNLDFLRNRADFRKLVVEVVKHPEKP